MRRIFIGLLAVITAAITLTACSSSSKPAAKVTMVTIQPTQTVTQYVPAPATSTQSTAQTSPVATPSSSGRALPPPSAAKVKTTDAFTVSSSELGFNAAFPVIKDSSHLQLDGDYEDPTSAYPLVGPAYTFLSDNVAQLPNGTFCDQGSSSDLACSDDAHACSFYVIVLVPSGDPKQEVFGAFANHKITYTMGTLDGQSAYVLDETSSSTQQIVAIHGRYIYLVEGFCHGLVDDFIKSFHFKA